MPASIAAAASAAPASAANVERGASAAADAVMRSAPPAAAQAQADDEALEDAAVTFSAAHLRGSQFSSALTLGVAENLKRQRDRGFADPVKCACGGEIGLPHTRTSKCDRFDF
jgi:hypothetical protein